MDETTGDTRHQERVVDLELDGMLERLLAHSEHVIELFGLGNGSRESIEDEAGSDDVSTATQLSAAETSRLLRGD